MSTPNQRPGRLVGSAALLAILVLANATRPLASMSWVRGGFLAVALILAVRATVNRRSIRTVGLGLALVVLLLTTREEQTLRLSAFIVAILFLGFVTGALLRDVMRQREVSTATLCDALSVYLLQAMFWVAVFGLVEEVAPGSFRGLPVHDDPDKARELCMQTLSYFSLVTLTTLGYGDVTPVSAWAQTTATLEAVFGQLFLVVLVARLVAQHATSTPE
jgi:voltage-gated potassium channel